MNRKVKAIALVLSAACVFALAPAYAYYDTGHVYKQCAAHHYCNAKKSCKKRHCACKMHHCHKGNKM